MSAAGRGPAAKRALRARQACLPLFWKVESSDKCQHTHAATWKWAVAAGAQTEAADLKMRVPDGTWELGAGVAGGRFY